MGPRRWLLILAVVAVLVLVAPPAVVVARDLVTRGAQLTTSTLDGLDIDEDPAALAAAAAAAVGHDVPLANYAGARMLRSEGGRHGPMSKLQRAHVALNDAGKHFGGDVYKCVTASSRGQTGFGSQTGRRYATSQDPFENDLSIWEQAIDERGQGIDRAKGAEKFVNISGFGVQDDTGTYQETLDSWAAQGFAPVALDDDNDEPDLVFFAKGTA